VPCQLVPILAERTDLDERESAADIEPGHPILIDPEFRIDPVLAGFLGRPRFVWLAEGTRATPRNVTGSSWAFMSSTTAKTRLRLPVLSLMQACPVRPGGPAQASCCRRARSRPAISASCPRSWS
jgi:hypothetical protein